MRDSVAGSDFVEEIDLVANPDDPTDLFGPTGALSRSGETTNVDIHDVAGRPVG
ncbi:hypothetical protein ACQCSX_06725 [Pseudarthrobacter sp. P1]|uniref:hypothetical protein n=1 Tax=Pseudarthrobacter sp. P1 TaxID=3418418 RepID=UPI003CF9EBEB